MNIANPVKKAMPNHFKKSTNSDKLDRKEVKL